MAVFMDVVCKNQLLSTKMAVFMDKMCFCLYLIWNQWVINKEKGQTVISDDLSFFAPVSVELLNLWNDFRKVVKFIDENPWVKPMLERIVKDKNRGMR